MSFAIASDAEQISPVDAVQDYLWVADRYGSSPFAPRALARIVVMTSPDLQPEILLRAARRLIGEHPGSREAEIGAILLHESGTSVVRPPEMEAAALVAARSGVRYRRAAWLALAARMQLAQGHLDNARATAIQSRDDAREMIQDLQRRGPLSEFLRFRPIIDAALQDSEALLNSTPSAVPPRQSDVPRQP
jgi:hypothetical protein